VFPDTEVRVFIDADPSVRGERRFKQQGAAERSKAVLKELRERDQRDRERAVSPLEPAADAVVIDSTRLSIDEVLGRIAQVIAEKSKGA
jgi:CMP/dCMP kinase